MVRIFLAHASEDKTAVIDLYQRLKARGFHPWLDKLDLRAGQNWRAEIPKAIRTSDVFIACLSKQSIAKQSYVQREFRIALQEMANKPPGKIYLIPLRLDDCDIPDLRQEESGISLRDYHWANLFEPDGFDQLVKDIEYGFADIQGSSTAVSTPSDADSSELPDSFRASQDSSYEDVLKRLKELEDRVKNQSAPKYDLRGAQFAGGFAETVLGNQIGEVVSNKSSASQEPPHQLATPSQKAPVRKTKPKEVANRSPKRINLGKGVILELVHIPGGTFLMGSPEGERDENEQPQHQVKVPEFWMGKYPVTQTQYRAVIGENPSRFKGGDRPVESVSWNDAIQFCSQASQKRGEVIRLPSEAEWEYACRAGTTTPYSFGETLKKEQANYRGGLGETSFVGAYPANQWGLYDMHGNVWEWCQDTWHGNYKGAPNDGSAWEDREDDSSRAIRGGSWINAPWVCRSAVRYVITPDFRDSYFGFRVVCSAPRILQ
ncbi:SUMF1/EgtB/PvdO family nonheme iron enzyme [Leptothoe kymatousa]|uniref:SUMF1/EgtB/PvdO family nonheme iron enzyme n=1 Tax=Leptothoe kymatousa TAU-MAC 1615 TaxID=2364775 RepID=A0ABS5Y3Z4_9CYAN|nr:SUMF1/EgtB/PvdO family nonheme iron enzyme [Leptothoe kymatousa]MBT9312545.1 SUMF1/EgtB/PvdO family nonheme iron enzyme [Leptothoe kymatousa TAU-MAC 1615]